MANANDIITAVKQKVAPGVESPELYFAIETQIQPSLRKLAAALSENESYVRMQKEFTEVVVTAASGRAEGVIASADILTDSIMERGVVLVNSRRAIPVRNLGFLEYPIADATISRYYVAGNKVYVAAASTVLNGAGGNINIKIIAKYVPTLANLPTDFEGELIDIIASQIQNSPEVNLMGLKVKQENPNDERG